MYEDFIENCWSRSSDISIKKHEKNAKVSNTTGKGMKKFNLKKDEVMVVTIDIDAGAANIPDLYKILSHYECERAQKFLFERDRFTYIITRGLLRIILGTLLHITPCSICFNYGKYGKPVIQFEGEKHIYFNTSHTRGKAIIAVTYISDIGVDIEYIRPLKYGNQILERFFSKEECNEIRSVLPGLQQRVFFTCWTRKEAVIKAVGRGLSMPLRCFTVTCTPDDPPKLLNIKWDREKSSDWNLFDIDVGESYSASLAVRGKKVRLIQVHWPSSDIFI